MSWISYNLEDVKGKYLYRFVTEENLMRFLKSGDLWFARADKFGDKMECVMIKDLMEAKPNFPAIEKRKKRHLICCLHEANNESLAFWDTHAVEDKHRRKYAIRFEREALVELVSKAEPPVFISNVIGDKIHGKIRYKNLINKSRDRLLEKTVKYPVFRKEFAFAYEREYRFVFRLTSECETDGFGLNLGIVKNLPFNVLVNPLLENKEYINCLKKIKGTAAHPKFKQSALAKWLKPELWK
jgi:hypothetical protein